MLAAAEAGDPTAFLALSAIVDGLRRTDERLARISHSDARNASTWSQDASAVRGGSETT
jgi:hypothetical protein